MSRSLRAPAVGAVLALLFVPQLASAGPILGWGYAVKVAAEDGGPFAHFGIDTKDWFIPPSPSGDPSQEGKTDYQMIAHIGASLSGQMTGSAVGQDVIHISSVGPAELTPYAMDDAWAAGVPRGFRITIRITDDSSSAFQDLSYAAHGSSLGFFLTGTGVTNVTVEERTDTFTLGGNEYTVHPSVRGSESAEHIELSVEVKPVPAATPEPGTLALAGIGLTAVVGLRRRRK
jgi:hypothetical protein